MKRYIFILIILTFIFSGCEDYLDKAPEQGITESQVFSDYYSIRGYLDNCYNALEDYHFWRGQWSDRNFIGAMSDEATSTWQGPIPNVINKGTWLDKENLMEIGWGKNDKADKLSRNAGAIQNAFGCIRIANVLIEKVPESNLTTEQKNEILGQAYFFRAWYYFNVIKRWGGMFKMDEPFTPNDELDLKRLTYQESHDWMMTDIEKAIEMLPEEWPTEQTGRANRMAAMAFREMAELYAASPLMQNGLDATADNGYNIDRCKTAARYAKEVLDYVDQRSEYRLMSDEEYTNIFYYKPHFAPAEALWYKNHAGDSRFPDVKIYFMTQRYGGGTGNWAWAVSAPTYNMVEKHEIVVDGQAFPQDDPRANYDPQKPFENRDPRFYNNFLVPGQQWGEKGGNPLYIESWQAGADGTSNGADYWSEWFRNSPTSIFLKKFWWETANNHQGGWEDYSYSCVFIRVSQVYLDYAEAMNEAYGPTSDPEGYGMTAVDAVNIIRNRVGMPNVHADFTSSKEAFRERIRNERAVELLYENHRWWDLRRWMIAEDVLGEPIQGFKVELMVPGDTPEDHEFRYSVIDVPTETRVFDIKHYWYPLPKNHIDHYTNLKQNPGW